MSGKWGEGEPRLFWFSVCLKVLGILRLPCKFREGLIERIKETAYAMPRSPYERRAQTELEAEDYFVEWKMRRPRIMRKGKYTQDFFNRFDLLAYKVGEALRWISIKGKAG